MRRMTGMSSLTSLQLLWIIETTLSLRQHEQCKPKRPKQMVVVIISIVFTIIIIILFVCWLFSSFESLYMHHRRFWSLLTLFLFSCVVFVISVNCAIIFNICLGDNANDSTFNETKQESETQRLATSNVVVAQVNASEMTTKWWK